MLFGFLENLWSVLLDAGPWLLLGLVAAGLIKAFISTETMTRWLGRPGMGSVVRAALIGTPLPLCSCGVLPAAVGIRHGGASRGATVSFLVATPVNGVDSIAVSYALLGPFLAIVRPIAGIITAIVSGFLSELVPHTAETNQTHSLQERIGDANPQPDSDACDSDSCCYSHATEDAVSVAEAPRGWGRKIADGLRYAMTDLYDEIAIWMGVGLVAAAIVITLVPPDALSTWGSGIFAMLGMILIGIPMYICATASIPLAASLLLAGVSPGTVLVFLLAGPATNIGSLAVIRRTIGTGATAAYLIGLCISAIALGLITDLVAEQMQISIEAQVEHAHGMLPQWFSTICVVILLVAAIRPLRKRILTNPSGRSS